MLFRPMKKRNQIILTIAIAIATVLLIAWTMSCHRVNKEAYRSETLVYQTGEFVAMDGNYTISDQENTNGYFVRVDEMRLVDYAELMERYGVTVQENELFPTNTYCIMLDITVRNEGNETGYIHCYGLNLYNGALMIPVDFEIWNMIDENINGNIVLKLRANSEVSLTIPYTPQLLDEAMNQKELMRRLEEQKLKLCLSEFPTVKMIEIKASY